MRSSSGRLSSSAPGVRPFPLLTPERPSSSTFTFVGFSLAEEVLLCMTPSSCSAVSDRTSAIRMSLAALHSCEQVPRGHRAPLGQFRILDDFSGVAESLLSSHDRPWCWSCKHQAHNALVLPPASTYRCKCHVTLVDTNCPLIPISTSGVTSSLLRRHSLSTRLDPSHRGLLPVSHLFVDSSRLSCFLIAPPGHHCVRLLSVRAVVYLLGLPRFCGCASALTQSTSQITVLARPSLVGDHMHCTTCIAFGSLHVLLARLTI